MVISVHVCAVIVSLFSCFVLSEKEPELTFITEVLQQYQFSALGNQKNIGSLLTVVVSKEHLA